MKWFMIAADNSLMSAYSRCSIPINRNAGGEGYNCYVFVGGGSDAPIIKMPCSWMEVLVKMRGNQKMWTNQNLTKKSFGVDDARGCKACNQRYLNPRDREIIPIRYVILRVLCIDDALDCNLGRFVKSHRSAYTKLRPSNLHSNVKQQVVLDRVTSSTRSVVTRLP